MQTFKDTVGRPWTLNVTVLSVERVKLLVGGVNLLALVEEKCDLMSRLASDPLLLFKTLYALCQPQIEKAGLDDEAFSNALVGDVLSEAFRALVEAIADFFPQPQHRKALRALVAKTVTVGEMVADHLLASMEAPVAAVDPSALLARLNGGSGRSPAPSASTPAPSPSGS